ncbi:MAG: tetratricopeptide repeat protein [Candidatus Azobacteroides sp.]|nr:tetratricopeptide repeat protein [Candidatus Azobacteroides sp.]
MHKIINISLTLFFFFSSFFSFGNNQAEATPEDKNEIQRKVEYFFLEAIKAKEARKLDVAYDLMRYCYELDSLNAPVMFELSVLYNMTGARQESLHALQKAVALNETNYWYQMALADQAEKMRLYELAIDTYDKMIRNFPDKPELNYNLASLYAQSGDTESAIEALDRLEEIIGVNETISLQKFRLYQFAGEDEKGYQEIEHLIRKYPYELKYVVLLGDLYLEADKPAEAYEYYQKALSIEPDNAFLAVSLANYYQAIGDSEAAKQQMSIVFTNPKIEIEEKIVYLGHYLQQSIKDSTDIPQAEALFVQLLEDNPLEADLHTMYGSLLISQGKLEEAKKEFEIVQTLTPDDKEIWMQLISLEGRENNYQGMIDVSNKALQQIPDTPEFYFYQGVAWYQLEEYENALNSFKTGVSVIPPENNMMLSDFYGQIGDINFKLNRKEEAFDAYEKAIEKNENNIGVLNNYAYYLSLENRDLDKAEKMSEVTVRLDPNNSTYLDTYAWIFFMKGNYTLAKFYLRKAMSHGGEENSEILEHYGDALYKDGEPEDALKYWERALEQGSDSETLKNKIETKTYIEP